jgi:hypothetical protein
MKFTQGGGGRKNIGRKSFDSYFGNSGRSRKSEDHRNVLRNRPALSTAPIPVGGKAVNGVIAFFMALLSFRGIITRAYRLKASNAAPPISTFPGATPLISLLLATYGLDLSPGFF